MQRDAAYTVAFTRYPAYRPMGGGESRDSFNIKGLVSQCAEAISFDDVKDIFSSFKVLFKKSILSEGPAVF
jgi:hypothetical protein